MKLIQSRRGIALVTVMMVSIILLALAGAFFAAHRSDLMLMGTSVKLEKTKNAALSAAEFFQYKLQNDRKFGMEPFVDGFVEEFPDDALDPMMTVEYVSDGSDFRSNVVRGTILKTGLTFEGRILNNLDEKSKGVLPGLGETPPRSVRVWITTKQGFIEKHMDFILKRSPFSSVSMLSGKDIEVDLASSEDGHWWLGARQPSGNAVRANGRVKGPEVLSSTGRAVLFEAPEGLTQLKPPYGVIQGQQLEMKMNGLSTPIEADDTRLPDVEANIEGVLSPGGAGVEVPKLEADTLTSPVNSFKLPTDKVTFRSRDNDGKLVHELLEGQSVVHTFDGNVNSSRTYDWVTSNGVPAATFDLEKRTMTVSGAFELESEQSSFTLGSEGGNQPTLILGNDDPSGVASISAQGIDIQGSVGGRGALKANEADLKIRAKSSLSTTPDFGVALHSNANVNLSKPGSSSNDGIPSDWDAFNQAFHELEDPEIDNWLQSEANKNEKAGDFSRVVLAPPGTDPGDDPVWLSLAEEFEVDQTAMNAYKEWTKDEIPEVKGPDPDWEPEEPPMIDDPSWDPGDPPLIANPDWEPGDPPMIPDPNWDPGEPPQIADPDFDPGEPPEVVLKPGQDAGPGFTVENYIRMREYLKTKEVAENGEGDESWLNPGLSSRRNDAKTLIKNQLTSFHLKAGQFAVQEDGQVSLEWNPLSTYFQGSNPFLTGYSADMSFRGLIYAGGNFSFDTEQQGIEIEGALVAHGDIDIINATGARIIYNSELLENLFVVNDGDTSAKLERAYWAYY